MEIAAVFKIVQKGNVWLVPSQTGNGAKYTVVPDKEQPHCTCPDHEAGFKCKHIFAVEYVIQREFVFNDLDGVQTVTETTTISAKAPRHDSPRNPSSEFTTTLAGPSASGTISKQSLETSISFVRFLA